jgi:hypothetical protein
MGIGPPKFQESIMLRDFAGVAVVAAIVQSTPAIGQTYWWCPAARAYYAQVQICPTGTWQQVGPGMPYGWPNSTKPRKLVYQRLDGTFGSGTLQEIEAERSRQAEQERLKRQQQEQQAAEREAREAQARIAHAEAEKAYQKAVFAQEAAARERGYKSITFDDFALDGKELASTHAMISVKGRYTKVGEAEWLFPSIMAAMMAQNTFQPDHGIALLAEDATRELRKFFLNCRNNMTAAAQGCEITILGHATMCARTRLLDVKEIPCVAVEDGWYIPPPT